MQKAPVFPNEAIRLSSLRALNLLDTLPESDFDQITKLASLITGMPIALVSLVDQDRQWFKSRVGLDVAQTPRDISFCGHAMYGKDVFFVPDSSKDERFADNPLVTGAPRVGSYAGAPLLSPDGHPLGTVCVIDHVPKQLSTQQLDALKILSGQVTRLLGMRSQVKEIEDLHHALQFNITAFASIGEGIVVQDRTGAIIDFNPSALKVLGLTADQLTGKSSLDPAWQATREDGSPLHGSDHPAMVTLQSGKTTNNFIMNVMRPSGERRWLLVNSVPVWQGPGEGPSHAVTSFADISELKNSELSRQALEVQLVDSARLASLGEIATGVAHEVNNPLAILRGWVEVLRRDFSSGNASPQGLEEILLRMDRAIDRIATIVRSFRVFSRQEMRREEEMTPVHRIVSTALDLCAEKFRVANIELTVDGKESIVCSVNSSQVVHLLMHLLSNSYDAVLPREEKWVRIAYDTDGRELTLKLIDSGQPIPSDVAAKIFDPFFTTKPMGKGMGLGLTHAFQIAQSHGGRIYLDGSAEHTTFVVELPIH